MENRVRFKIGEIEFEAEGSAEVVERERSVFLNALLPAAVDAVVRTRGVIQQNQCIENSNHQELLPINVAEVIPPAFVSDDLSRTSLSSYIKNYGTLSDQDFTIIAAYYDEKKNATPMFSSENVKQYYADARRCEYSNFSGLLYELARKGLIMDAPNPTAKTPKQYVLTLDGMAYVESYVPKQESMEKKIKSKSRKIKSKVESPYANLSADDLNLKNYPEIKKLDSFKKQMILIMYIVGNEGKGDYFTVSDVQCLLTDILGLPATIDQINGIFAKNKSWFKAEEDINNKKALRRKLLEGAKDFVKELIA